MKSKYQVGIQIYNSFEVEANSEEEAEEIVRELSIESTLRDSDYNITYVDEIKSSMQSSDEREKAINHTA
jgi:hypothetical protein